MADFLCTASLRRSFLVFSLIAGVTLAMSTAARADRTEVVSRGDASLAARTPFGNGDSTAPVMSSDGRYVAFLSRSRNLTSPAGSATVNNAYRRDMDSGAVRLVSLACLAESYCVASSAAIANPAISADGRYVAFTSAGQVLPGETSATYSIYLRDVEAGTTERVTVDGEAATSDPKVAVSSDGRWVAYSTPLLPDGTRAARNQLVVRDMTLAHDDAGARRIVSHTPQGAAGDGTSYHPSFSADGRTLAFASQSSDLDDAGAASGDAIFVASLPDLELERVSLDGDGAPVTATVPTAYPLQNLSANGRRVLFASGDPALKPEGVDGLSPTSVQLYVRDRDSGTVEPVSLDPASGSWAASASIGALSGDGRSVAFTAASAFAPLPDEATSRVSTFVRRLDGALERVSLGADGELPDAPSSSPSISAEGRYVTFLSQATNLVPSGTFNAQVFRRDTREPEPPEPSEPSEPSPGGDDGGATVGPLVTTTTVVPAVPGMAGRDATLERGNALLSPRASSIAAKRLRSAGVAIGGGVSGKGRGVRLAVSAGSILRSAEARTRGSLRFQRRVGGRLRTVRLDDVRTFVGPASVRVTAKHGRGRITAFTVTNVAGRVIDPVGGRVAVRTGALRLNGELARILRRTLKAPQLRSGLYGRFALTAAGTPRVAGTPAIPGWTSTVTAPAPATPAPTNPPNPDPGTEEPVTVIGATSWAFQKSFRSYVSGGDGNPPLQASDGATNDIANDTFHFSATEGSFDTASGTGRVVNRGRIVFDYPGHYFKITIADPTVVIEGATGYLEAYGKADLYGVEGEGKRVRMAELDLSAAERSVDGSTVSISNVSATLTAEAAPLFGGFWAPGQQLAPISFSADIG